MQIDVREIIIGAKNSKALSRNANVWVQPANSAWRTAAKTELDSMRARGELNNSQIGAIVHAVSGTVTLIQGPPGTGKTRTLIAIIRVRTCALQHAVLG